MKTKSILVIVFLVLLLLALAVPVGAQPSYPGACCMPDGSCQDGMPALVCSNLGGDFQGEYTACSEVSCPGPGPVGGATEPLGVLAAIAPAVALGVVAAAGATIALLVKRRAA